MSHEVRSVGSTPERFSSAALDGLDDALLLVSGGIRSRSAARKEDRTISAFSRHRSLSRVLDDAFQSFYHNPFEVWLGGLFGRLRTHRAPEGRGENTAAR